MEIREHEPLSCYTTMKIGGTARYFAEARNEDDLIRAGEFASEKRLPTFFLGGGSNTVFGDGEFPGLVMRVLTKGMTWRDSGRVAELTVSSGEVWDDVVAESVRKNFSSLANLSGIPGTVGGALVQNVGAYGAEIADHITSITVHDPISRVTKTLSRDECHFGYRESIFKCEEGRGLAILSATLCLSRDVSPDISYKDLTKYFADNPNTPLSGESLREAVLFVRNGKFPDLFRHGTAGSYFKNPIVARGVGEKFLSRFPDAPNFPLPDGRMKLSAGWIIDHALGMRGVREGSVGTWPAQALVVVNYGGASEQELHTFTEGIVRRSQSELGIELIPEVVTVRG